MGISGSPQQHASRHSLIAAACGILGPTLMVIVFLLRDVLPAAHPLRDFVEEWFVVSFVIACLLSGYPSFVWGLIHGVDREPHKSWWSRTPGQSRWWLMIAVGVALIAVAAIGHFGFDRSAARLGGLPGFMRSLSIPIAGFFLLSWGWERPAWWMPLVGPNETARTPTTAS